MAAAKEQFLRLLGESVAAHRLVKLTLGGYHGPDATLRNLHVRPVALRAGPHLSFVWRHASRDITANHPPAAALELLAPLIGGDFGTAHLFTTIQDAQLEFAADGSARLKLRAHEPVAPPSEAHDRPKQHLIGARNPWLHELGVTTAAGAPREGMAAKFKQINRFTELLAPLLEDAPLPADRPVEVADMGCGKGYLTFAVWQHFHDHARQKAHVRGIEQRTDLVELCNRVARQCGCGGLEFAAGSIAATPLGPLDVLIALHACDTATDDAVAQGVAAGAGLIVVAPCCHKEVRPQLAGPAELRPVLRHGIFHERQAEFLTDALRTLLLEWAGYDTRAFEFISTEHTAKNLMIAAVRRPQAADRDAAALRVRALAAAYGVRTQRLAARLGFPLAP
ncbi:MAG TPA: SAM-dependent methyltransferase [Opitutaceae bacterium]|nr:SAM-dependent methyltransferase [Opitutaceae bacterium]